MNAKGRPPGQPPGTKPKTGAERTRLYRARILEATERELAELRAELWALKVETANERLTALVQLASTKADAARDHARAELEAQTEQAKRESK